MTDRLKSSEMPKNIQKANIATMYKTGTIFNELEQDLLEFIISQIDIYDESKNFQWITFKVTDFFFVSGRKFRPYNEVRAALYKIRDTGILINDVSYTSWITSVDCPSKTSIFSVEINQTIKGFLGFISGSYVTYKGEYIYCLRSVYAKKIYPVLKAALLGKNIKEKEFSLKELRELLSIQADKYQKYNDFKKRVILSIQKEINGKTDISFDFREEKYGHAVYKLIFIIKTNIPIQQKNTHTENELDSHHPMYVLFDKYKFGNKFKRQLFGLNSTDVELMTKNLKAANDYITEKGITDEKQMFAIYTDSVNKNWQPKPEKQKENEKQDSGYSYKKEKEFEKQKQPNKTVPVDETFQVVDTIPDKTEFDEILDANFKKKLKNFDSLRIEILMDENNIHFYLDSKNLKVKVYVPESSLQYCIDNKIEHRFNRLLNPYQNQDKIIKNEIIPSPFDTDDGITQLSYSIILIGVKE